MTLIADLNIPDVGQLMFASSLSSVTISYIDWYDWYVVAPTNYMVGGWVKSLMEFEFVGILPLMHCMCGEVFSIFNIQ